MSSIGNDYYIPPDVIPFDDLAEVEDTFASIPSALHAIRGSPGCPGSSGFYEALQAFIDTKESCVQWLFLQHHKTMALAINLKLNGSPKEANLVSTIASRFLNLADRAQSLTFRSKKN
jgi:hypothetical protein